MTYSAPLHKKHKVRTQNIYMETLITQQMVLPFTLIGNNIKEILEQMLVAKTEGTCIVEGFVKPNSCKILTYSSGILHENNIIFEIVFECAICSPVEGMLIECTAKNITKAGIRAEIIKENISPVVVFIAHDHHYKSKYFSLIKENDDIVVRVIGQRFELNDTYISVIAELVEPKKPRIVLR